MLREILRWVFPVAVFMGVAVLVSLSGGFPLWTAVLGMLALVGITITLVGIIEWLY